MNLKTRLRCIIDPTQEIVRVLVVGICMGALFLIWIVLKS